MLARNDSSRLGPTSPLVLARASVWQDPHLATKACLPLISLALSAPFTEHPAAAIAAPASAPATATRQPSARRRARRSARATLGTSVVLIRARNIIRTR